MENLEQPKKYNAQGIILAVVAVLLVTIIGITYAWLTVTKNAQEVNVIKTGTFDLTFDKENEGIYLEGENAEPMTDEEGKEHEGYNFTLTNNGDIEANYTIYLDNVSTYNDKESQPQNIQDDNRLPDSNIKYSLTYDESTESTALLSTTGEHPNRKLYTGTLAAGVSKQFNLKLWVDKDATSAINGKVFAGKIRVEAIQSKSKKGTDNSTNPVPAPSKG